MTDNSSYTQSLEMRLLRKHKNFAMLYLVQFGSLTIVARSPFEALRLRKQFLDDESGDVMITDMDGFPVDVDQLQQVVTDNEEGPPSGVVAGKMTAPDLPLTSGTG